MSILMPTPVISLDWRPGLVEPRRALCGLIFDRETFHAEDPR